MKIDWKSKLSSRKFWAAIAAWLTSLLTAFHVSESNAAQIVVIVSGIGSLAVYMLAEAIVDARKIRNSESGIRNEENEVNEKNEEGGNGIQE